MSETGVSFYFRVDRIRMRYQTIIDLGRPQYVHFRVDERRKWMFIQACERDQNAFTLFYKDEGRIHESKNFINAKRFLTYLANVVGVPRDSESLFFPGVLIPEMQAVFIDLRNYERINEEVEDD